MPIRNPRWLPPQVIILTQDHMGKYRNIFFSEAIALIEPKLCINHQKVLYKLCVFYVDQNSKMTTTAGHSFYIRPIGSFYNQVNNNVMSCQIRMKFINKLNNSIQLECKSCWNILAGDVDLERTMADQFGSICHVFIDGKLVIFINAK